MAARHEGEGTGRSPKVITLFIAILSAPHKFEHRRKFRDKCMKPFLTPYSYYDPSVDVEFIHSQADPEAYDERLRQGLKEGLRTSRNAD